MLRRDALPVVQIKQHGRAGRGGFQQIAKFAQHMRPDGFALIGGHHEAVRALIQEHVEMVEPEVDQLFLKLAIAVDGAVQLAFRKIAATTCWGLLASINLRRSSGLADGSN